MRTLKIIEHISLDGVIQHSADDGDVSYSDWTARYRTPAGRDLVLAAHGARFDLLLGRRTYDIWSGFWPKAPSSPIGGPPQCGHEVRRDPELVSTTATPTGVLLNTYKVIGPLKA
jgi:dihydrofolate reductase